MEARGGTRPVRVFSKKALIIIAQRTRTPVARAFQFWAAEQVLTALRPQHTSVKIAGQLDAILAASDRMRQIVEEVRNG